MNCPSARISLDGSNTNSENNVDPGLPSNNSVNSCSSKEQSPDENLQHRLQVPPFKRGRGRPPLIRPVGFIPERKRSIQRSIQKLFNGGDRRGSRRGGRRGGRRSGGLSHRDVMPKLTLSSLDANTNTLDKFPVDDRHRKSIHAAQNKSEESVRSVSQLPVHQTATKISTTCPEFEEAYKQFPSLTSLKKSSVSVKISSAFSEHSNYALRNGLTSISSKGEQAKDRLSQLKSAFVLVERGHGKTKSLNDELPVYSLPKNSIALRKRFSFNVPLSSNVAKAPCIAVESNNYNKCKDPLSKLIGFPLPSNFLSLKEPNSCDSSSSKASSSAAQILDNVVKNQWKPGSDFLMEEAQRCGVGNLLSECNKLRQENEALEDYIKFLGLVKRKNDLLSTVEDLSTPRDLSHK